MAGHVANSDMDGATPRRSFARQQSPQDPPELTDDGARLGGLARTHTGMGRPLNLPVLILLTVAGVVRFA